MEGGVHPREATLLRRNLKVYRKQLEGMFKAADFDEDGVVDLRQFVVLDSVKKYFDTLQKREIAQAQQRLQQYGPNELAEKKKEPGWQAFLRQYKDLMQIVLLSAAVINQIFVGEWGTTLVLVGLTVFNAVLDLVELGLYVFNDVFQLRYFDVVETLVQFLAELHAALLEVRGVHGSELLQRGGALARSLQTHALELGSVRGVFAFVHASLVFVSLVRRPRPRGARVFGPGGPEGPSGAVRANQPIWATSRPASSSKRRS